MGLISRVSSRTYRNQSTSMSMIAETLDIDGILDKRPYKPPPFTDEELADLKSQAKITISNQETSITEQLGSLTLDDSSGISSLYLFTGKQPCEIALELLARTGFKTQGRQKKL